MAEYLAALDTADAAEAEPEPDPQAVRAAPALLQQARAGIERLVGVMDAPGEKQVTLSEPGARRMKGQGPA